MTTNRITMAAKSKPRGRKAVSLPFVICRCSAAGVHAGYLVSRNGDEVTLSKSRRLWRWVVPIGKGSFLSGVALHGLGDGAKVGEAVDLTLLGVCEVIATAPIAQSSIEGYANVPRVN